MTVDSFTAAVQTPKDTSLDFTINSGLSASFFLNSPNASGNVDKLEMEAEEDKVSCNSIYSELNDDVLPPVITHDVMVSFIKKQTVLLKQNESLALPPKELHGELQKILARFPHYPAAHFLISLNFLRVRETRKSVEALTYSYDTQQVNASTPRSPPLRCPQHGGPPSPAGWPWRGPAVCQ